MSDINPGIVRTVQWLNDNGFDTCDSGDGATHDFDCDRPYPYVVMKVAPEAMVSESQRLKLLLLRKGICVAAQGVGPCIQVTYDPADELAFIDLSELADKDWPGRQPLKKKTRMEAKAMAELTAMANLREGIARSGPGKGRELSLEELIDGDERVLVREYWEVQYEEPVLAHGCVAAWTLRVEVHESKVMARSCAAEVRPSNWYRNIRIIHVRRFRRVKS